MNDNVAQPSDNRLALAASFLRRSEDPVSANKASALPDELKLPHPLEQQYHEPERWDGLS